VLPLGKKEKLFLEIKGGAALEAHVFGNLRDSETAAYYIRPFRWLIDAVLGGDRMLEDEGPATGFSHVVDEVDALFRSDVRSTLRPLAASNWSRMPAIGGHTVAPCPAMRPLAPVLLNRSMIGSSSQKRRRTSPTSRRLMERTTAEGGLLRRSRWHSSKDSPAAGR
jgi:hypothetical protein